MLTDKQRLFLARRTLKVGDTYVCPQWGFTVFHTPNSISTAEYVDCNPFSKAISSSLIVKELREDGLVKVNFTTRPYRTDFYLREAALQRREVVEILFLYVTCYIPMVLWNLITKKR